MAPDRGTSTNGTGDVLEVTEVVRASPHTVFDDLTVPARLLAWWGDPSKWWLTDAQVDLRVGGEFWVTWANTAGATDRMGGRYTLIEPGRKLVSSFIGSHDKAADDQLEIELHAEQQSTRVTLRHSGLAGRPLRYADYQRGWVLILSWLARYHARPA